MERIAGLVGTVVGTAGNTVGSLEPGVGRTEPVAIEVRVGRWAPKGSPPVGHSGPLGSQPDVQLVPQGGHALLVDAHAEFDVHAGPQLVEHEPRLDADVEKREPQV